MDNNEIYMDCGFSFHYTKIKDLPAKYWVYENKIKQINPDIDIIGFIIDKNTNCGNWKVLLTYEGIVYNNSNINNLTQRTQKFKIPYNSIIDYYIKKINNPNSRNIDYWFNDNIEIEKSKIKINLKCRECGWEWNYRLDNWLSETRYELVCPFHNMQYIDYTHHNYKKLIYRNKIQQTIKILGLSNNTKKISAKSKLHLECVCGYDWKSTDINKLISGRGCPKCNNRINYTHENVEERLYERLNFCGFKFINSIVNKNEKVNSKTQIKIKCICGKETVKSISNIRSKLITCRTCSSSGGFRKENIGTLYVQEIQSNGVIISYKFGITNRDPIVRMNEIIKGSIYEHKIIFQFTSTGNDVSYVENLLKKNVTTGFICSNEMKFGWSETINPDDIEKIHDIIVDYLT